MIDDATRVWLKRLQKEATEGVLESNRYESRLAQLREIEDDKDAMLRLDKQERFTLKLMVKQLGIWMASFVKINAKRTERRPSYPLEDIDDFTERMIEKAFGVRVGDK